MHRFEHFLVSLSEIRSLKPKDSIKKIRFEKSKNEFFLMVFGADNKGGLIIAFTFGLCPPSSCMTLIGI